MKNKNHVLKYVAYNFNICMILLSFCDLIIPYITILLTILNNLKSKSYKIAVLKSNFLMTLFCESYDFDQIHGGIIAENRKYFKIEMSGDKP